MAETSTPPPAAFEPADPREAALIRSLNSFFDPAWYMQRYQDVAAAKLDPMHHFIRHGMAERRDPNRFFDSAWYAEHYVDVNASGLHPLTHYLKSGAAELRNPHPGFDAAYYVSEHPEAAANPLLYHIKIGAGRGYLTEKPIDIRDYLPSGRAVLPLPRRVLADVVIPVYRGFEETRRCIESVLADPGAPLTRVIVVDDQSPEPDLAAWLQELAEEQRICLVRNPRNSGFVASVNRGMAAAGDHDVVLLNSDTEVPAGWLSRLAAQAYAEARIATVSPFSNNATICGYPDNDGGPVVFGKSLAEIDEVCATVNAARCVDVPTTVGFCMYIRREALREVGGFDAEYFGDGYGEENDFCLRATALGWRHRLACDTFVYHKGSVSFGDSANERIGRAMELIQARYPGYTRVIAQHVGLDAVAPFRFAVTAGLFQRAKLPVILMISHSLGGGVRHHIETLVERVGDKARILLLEATDRGTCLSVPSLPNHPKLTLPAERIGDLVLVLRSTNASRIHIHHLMAMDIDIRALVRGLGLPFDVTVHDYHGICPQTNLLPRPEGLFCGEPDIAACNACIAARPSHGAVDILTWRAERAWQFLEADRVLCPSADVASRLQRFGLGARTVLAPHEPVTAGFWPLHISQPRNGKLRIAVLGVLADHKGARTVASVAEVSSPESIEIHLIGHTEKNFPQPALERLRVTGKYDDQSLPEMIREVAPDVIWFPGVLPETYSYTLSAAIASGTPIVATAIGAFPERLAGRPFTWLVEPRTSPAEWIALFVTVQAALASAAGTSSPQPRPAVNDFYAADYLQPVKAPVKAISPPPPIRMRGTSSRPVIAVVPERYDIGLPTPCGYIRLLQPLDHPATGGGARVVMTDAKSVHDYDVDIIVTQRYALADLAAADTLAGHARRTGAVLVYDLDDDLLNIPSDHPDGADLRPRATIVRRMLDAADAVWVSTDSLKRGLSSIRPDALVIENRLDERIWAEGAPSQTSRDDPVRILCMGTSTHDQDYALIEPALARLKHEYGGRVVIDIIGMTNKAGIAPGLNRIGPPPGAGQSYPGFVNWLTSVWPRWHIGLAPLLDTPFNHSKSPIKTMDYAAMGMAVLASDVAVYRGSLADGPAGQLVKNDYRAWFAALDWLVRDQTLRRSMGRQAREAFLARATLASDPGKRREAWTHLLEGRARLAATGLSLRRGKSSPTIAHDQTELVTRKRRYSGRG